MNDIQPIIDALQQKLPWLAALTTAMGLLRLVAKPLSALVQSFFTKLLTYVQGTPEKDDDAWLEKILATWWYRTFAFVVDWVLSVKLPTSQGLKERTADKVIEDWAKSEPKPPAPSNIVGPPPVVGFLIAGFLAGVVLLGAGCRSIAPGGAYNGDTILFEADTTITTSYTLVDTFLKWEADNRVVLSQWPEIKKYADKLRTDYPYWQRTAIALREAYAAAPSEAQGANLQRSLTLLRTALLEASGYMARAAAVK